MRNVGQPSTPRLLDPPKVEECQTCHVSCRVVSSKRPCTRCEKAGRAHLCSDVPLRKRGRPRRSDSAAKDNVNHNNKLTHAQHQHKQRQPPPPPSAAPLPHSQPPHPHPRFPGVATTTTTSVNGTIRAEHADLRSELPGSKSSQSVAGEPHTHAPPHTHTHTTQHTTGAHRS